MIKNLRLSYFHLSIILTLKGEIVTYGINEQNIRPSKLPSKHSEVKAYENLMKLVRNHRLNKKHLRKGFVMINYAFTYNGTIRISKPCCHCSKFLKNHKNLFRTVWYSEADGDFNMFKNN